MLAAEAALTVALRRALATSKSVQVQLGARFFEDLVRPGDPTDALRCQWEQDPAAQGLPTEPLILHVSRSLLQIQRSGSNRNSGSSSSSKSYISSGATAAAAANTAIGGDPLQELPKVEIDYDVVQHAVSTASIAHGELQLLLTSCDCAPCRCTKYVPTVCRPDVCQCTHPATHHQLRLPDITSNSSPALLQADAAVSVVLALGIWGLLQLLGLRRTVGSLPQCPPPRAALQTAFNARHSTAAAGSRTASDLTVGARALAKHTGRAASGWWGSGLRGSEAEKNAAAAAVLDRILAEAVWLNVHQFAGAEVYEVRQLEGYGARWTADGLLFRGFLEPHAHDGHEKQWRH
jgi:hypothetical protein